MNFLSVILRHSSSTLISTHLLYFHLIIIFILRCSRSEYQFVISPINPNIISSSSALRSSNFFLIFLISLIWVNLSIAFCSFCFSDSTSVKFHTTTDFDDFHLLQLKQDVTRLSTLFHPPSFTEMQWSTSRIMSKFIGSLPQYWQQNPSLSNIPNLFFLDKAFLIIILYKQKTTLCVVRAVVSAVCFVGSNLYNQTHKVV